jgi:ankyrin repeat protein
LIHAATKGDLDTVRALLENHAEVNVRVKDDATPLSRANEFHNGAMVELLRALVQILGLPIWDAPIN